jgi:DNA-binding NarL/FixJ family response regulator
MTYLSRCQSDSDHILTTDHSFTVHAVKKVLSNEGAAVQEPGVRILVVEDYAKWSHFICSTLEQTQDLTVVGMAADGVEAVEKARQLKPDLILLDIGLPGLDGIEAARRIASSAPQSKIIFITENHDSDIVKEALNTGARGYVLKSRAACDLMPAIDAVLRGETFVSDHLGPSHG